MYLGWMLSRGTGIPASGYVTVALGVIISLGVGFGLMPQIFHSSRNEYDAPPVGFHRWRETSSPSVQELKANLPG
jgi:hypothetical protein